MNTVHPERSRGALLLLLTLLSSGCSVLFDPSKAPPKACPASPASCPALPNATASCAEETCSYTCTSTDFVDANGDLTARTSDGCELSCTGSAPANPASLTAKVGARAGEIEWSFPAAPPAVRYQLCTSLLGAAEICSTVAPATQCTGGLCQLTTTGHPDNARVSGKVTSFDVCNREGSMATAATISATSLDLSSPTGWILEKTCPASTSSVIGGQLAIENSAASCISSLVGGDELWGDFTLDADLRYSGIPTDSIIGGLVFQLNATGHRMSAIVAPSSGTGNELSFLSQRKNAMEKFVAASIVGGSATGLTHLRVTSHGGVISFSHGPDEQRLVEVLRWSDGTSRTGRLGMGLVGTGRAELTNFRVTTPGTLPTGSPTSVLIDFADGGFPPNVRKKVPLALRVELCPTLPSSARCDGGCLPAPNANCARVERVGFSFPNFLVDLPAGIDVRAPYSLSFRMASAPDAGGAFPAPLNCTQGLLLGANTWFGTTRGLTQEYGVVLEPGAWHSAAWNFNPDAGTFALSLDEQLVTPPGNQFPPMGWSPHLGAFSFGEGVAADLYVTDLRISQP